MKIEFVATPHRGVVKNVSLYVIFLKIISKHHYLEQGGVE